MKVTTVANPTVYGLNGYETDRPAIQGIATFTDGYVARFFLEPTRDQPVNLQRKARPDRYGRENEWAPNPNPSPARIAAVMEWFHGEEGQAAFEAGKEARRAELRRREELDEARRVYGVRQAAGPFLHKATVEFLRLLEGGVTGLELEQAQQRVHMALAAGRGEGLQPFNVFKEGKPANHYGPVMATSAQDALERTAYAMGGDSDLDLYTVELA